MIVPVPIASVKVRIGKTTPTKRMNSHIMVWVWNFSCGILPILFYPLDFWALSGGLTNPLGYSEARKREAISSLAGFLAPGSPLPKKVLLVTWAWAQAGALPRLILGEEAYQFK